MPTTLATLANFKSYLNLSSVAGADLELQRLLDMAGTVAERYMERTILTGARTEKRSGNGTDLLLLRDSPITAVSELKIDGTVIPASDGTSAGYLFVENQLYLIGYLFNCGRRNVSIAYTAGFAAVPDDISHAVIETAAQAYREKDWVGFTSKTLAGETVSFARQGIPESAKTAFDAYRRGYACD